MAATDLTGATIGQLDADGLAPWIVTVKAPPQQRCQFWTVVHTPCGVAVDLAQTLLQKAIKGKSTIPPCAHCTPADAMPALSHGMHLACGTTHLTGTACPDGVQREPGPGVFVERIEATEHAAAGVILRPAVDLDSLPDEPDATPAAEPATWDLDRGQHVPDPVAPAVIVSGPCDRLEAPQDVLEVIRRTIADHPRGLQDAVGPSELGGCERRLGHRMAFGQQGNGDPNRAWRPTVGTAVHAWLAEAFGSSGGRWLADYTVTAPVGGTLDLFDVEAGRVIDFKVVGKATLDRARRGDVDEQYQGQVQLYGLGMTHDGYDVRSVALLFLPAAGELNDAAWWEAPYDAAQARALVARRDKILAMLSVAVAARVLSVLEATGPHCGYCPALGEHCAGVAEAAPAPALTLARFA